MRTLDDAAEFLSGGTPKKSDATLWNGDIPWYSASNMTQRYLADTETTITQEGLRVGSRLAPKGATLILVRGSGLFNHIPICFADRAVAFNQDVKAIVSKEGVDPVFLHFWIESLRPRLNENIGVTGIGAGKFDLDFLKQLPFPDFKESKQRKLGEFAEAFDRRIDANRRMNETLEAMARAIFKDWFVDFGPTRAKTEDSAPYLAPEIWGLFPDLFEDDGKPAGWRFCPVAEFFDFNPREVLKKGTLSPYLDMAALPTKGPISEAPASREYKSGSKFRDGDTLFARITPCLENGKTAYVFDLGDDQIGAGSTEFIVIRSRRPVPSFASYLLARDPGFRETAAQSMTGTSGRQRADKDSLAQYSICAPTDDAIWAALEQLIEPVVARIISNANEMRTLSEARDLLLSRLLSGEVELGDAERTAEAVV